MANMPWLQVIPFAYNWSTRIIRLVGTIYEILNNTFVEPEYENTPFPGLRVCRRTGAIKNMILAFNSKLVEYILNLINTSGTQEYILDGMENNVRAFLQRLDQIQRAGEAYLEESNLDEAYIAFDSIFYFNPNEKKLYDNVKAFLRKSQDLSKYSRNEDAQICLTHAFKLINKMTNQRYRDTLKKSVNSIKSYQNGKKLWEEACEDEELNRLSEAKMKFEEAKQCFKEAYELSNNTISEYNDWMNVVEYKIQGNELYNQSNDEYKKGLNQNNGEAIESFRNAIVLADKAVEKFENINNHDTNNCRTFLLKVGRLKTLIEDKLDDFYQNQAIAVNPQESHDKVHQRNLFFQQ